MDNISSLTVHWKLPVTTLSSANRTRRNQLIEEHFFNSCSIWVNYKMNDVSGTPSMGVPLTFFADDIFDPKVSPLRPAKPDLDAGLIWGW
jgi:hypothetical protein